MVGSTPQDLLNRQAPESESEMAEAKRLAEQAIDDEPWEKWWCEGRGRGRYPSGTQPMSVTEPHQRSLSLAADAVVAVHVVFVALVLAGGFLASLWPGAAAVHVL